jgi:mono/diheme cytochrome c family protein
VRNFVLGFVAAAALFMIGLVGFLRLGFLEVRGDVGALSWQSKLFHSAVRASVRRSAPREESPLSHTDDELIAGGKLYLGGCAGCHGKPGRPPRLRNWFFPPPEFAHSGTQFSEPQVFWIIKHGIRRTGMSAYGFPGGYSDQEIWLLSNFVIHMKDLPPSVKVAILPGDP